MQHLRRNRSMHETDSGVRSVRTHHNHLAVVSPGVIRDKLRGVAAFHKHALFGPCAIQHLLRRSENFAYPAPWRIKLLLLMFAMTLAGLRIPTLTRERLRLPASRYAEVGVPHRTPIK